MTHHRCDSRGKGGNRQRWLLVMMLTGAAFAPGATARSDDGGNPRHAELEEVVVTAQRREQSLQVIPVSAAVLDAGQLQLRGITRLGDLNAGAVPSLRVAPNPEAPSTLVMVIRGNGPIDIGPITRESSVVVYRDGFYLGRPRGLDLDLSDLERLEVLRGPQGSLFGRNAIGGAINLISRRPTGQWGVRQTLGVGRFGARRSVTILNTPDVAGLRTKIGYLNQKRNGWVDNPAPDASDPTAYQQWSANAQVSWKPNDTLRIDYRYGRTNLDAVQNYHQIAVDNVGVIGVESTRQRVTRVPVTPLQPTVTDHEGHGLTIEGSLSKTLTLRSLTGYRTLDEHKHGNFAGAVYLNGLVLDEIVGQHQFSQELQLLGERERLAWVGGLYYFRESASEFLQNYFSLDSLGVITGTPLTPIPLTTVFTTLQPGIGVVSTTWPARNIQAEARSAALYAHATWRPPFLSDRWQLIAGARYSEDQRRGHRAQGGALNRFVIDSHHIDPTLAVDYLWREGVSSYLSWRTGYKSGGVNPRSAELNSFDQETVETWELGFKSEWWQRRLRVNGALFRNQYDDMQLDFNNPINPVITETINAQHPARVGGGELDITLAPRPDLVMELSYTYLDGDMPLQPNLLDGGAPTMFFITQTPRHAGAASIDYTMGRWRFGTVHAHVDLTSTGQYAHSPIHAERFDAYTLWNARLSLTDIEFGGAGRLSISAWGKNLTDEEYVVFAYAIGNPTVSVIQAFGEPRTLGVDMTYEFE